MKITTAVVLVLLALAVAAPQASAAPGSWAQVGADANHTGASSDTTFPLSSLSSTTVEAQFQAPNSPAVASTVADGWVYVPFTMAGFTGRIAGGPDSTGVRDAVDYVTPGAIDDQPIVDRAGSRLWVLDSTGTLWAFAAKCAANPCEPVAHARVGSCPTACDASPVVDSGTVVAATSDGRIEAFPADCTGACAPVWSADAGAGVHATPAMSGGLALIGTDRGVQAYSLPVCRLLHACAPLWTSPSAAASTVAVDAADDIAFWTSADGNLYGAYGCLLAVVTRTCEPRIVTSPGGGPLHAPPVIDAADHLVIVALPDGRVDAFHAARCALLTRCGLSPAWQVTLPLPLDDTSPALADGVAWVGDDYGFIWAMPAAGCGALICGYGHPGPAGPGYQLDAGIGPMWIEVADSRVWATQEGDDCTCGTRQEYVTDLRLY